ncbi:MAG TPA: glycosyltransferase [Solirubrobacteraceae bacterium]|nr:glycosyltransferase [Solirubrobacteraceae bacterium]
MAGAEHPRVLFVCADPVAASMRGLGIRCWELARAMSRSAEVTIAHGGTTTGMQEGVRLLSYEPHAPSALASPAASADMIVAHPQWPAVDRMLRRSRARVVIDLYCPETLETLELFAAAGPLERGQRTATTLDRLHAALRTGHNFVCASETQRDLWLGTMLALRLITPSLYEADPSLREVIDVVPFGVPGDPPPAAARGGVRAAIPAIPDEAEIVLWNGGIWRWLDAQTAIRAVAELARRRRQVRLVFMGGADEHPAAREAAAAARELARELGLLDRVVHFHQSWVPYGERAAWLADAACAVSAHAEHLETRFAYRTRLLDCLWAGVPIVCTSGDDLADLVARERLGAVAPPGDTVALARALEEVLREGRDSYAQRLRNAAAGQTWARACAPLVRWSAHPRPGRRPGEAPGVVRPPTAQRAREAAYLLGGRSLLARGGLPGLTARRTRS